MREDFLHYLWEYRLLDSRLTTTDGEEIEVVFPGYHNGDAGPDFTEAKIRIGEVLWVGNVEIHIHTSDWFKHGHQQDENYDNIILHVVYRRDKELRRSNGELIPQLEIAGKFDETLLMKYTYFLQNRHWIPCEKELVNIPRIHIHSWIDRLIVERMEQRAEEIEQRLSATQNNWEQAFYETMARSFGFHVNAQPFELLAQSLPLRIIAKQKDNKLQIEALLFGQAGMLEESFSDEYPRLLQNEYAFLQRKYKLIPLPAKIWKFARMRPGNFPTIRIAQFADLLFRSSHLFSKVLEIDNLKEIQQLLNVELSPYWRTHYVFDKSSVNRRKTMSKQSVNLLLINTIIPFLFYYGKVRGREELCRRALRFLEQMPGEKNAIVKRWETLGIPVLSALNTQALLHLKNNYCNRKKCLRCTWGVHLLKK